jgi:hypothetical protein
LNPGRTVGASVKDNLLAPLVGCTHVVLSSEQRRVINMHRNLEPYLDLPESERMTGGGIPA